MFIPILALDHDMVIRWSLIVVANLTFQQIVTSLCTIDVYNCCNHPGNAKYASIEDKNDFSLVASQVKFYFYYTLLLL